jgi:beta-galactosidase
MKYYTLISFGIIFFYSSVMALPENRIRLADNWKFLRSDIGSVWETVRPIAKADSPENYPIWENVSLPHCFNVFDAVDPDVNYYQGPGWYTNRIAVNNPYPQGRTVLHFAGAGQTTEVYVYMTKVASHVGGYDEWDADITDAVNTFLADKKLADSFGGKIPLAIRCDNSRNTERIPSDMSDFTIYGGIYRYLDLVYLPELSINQLHVKTDLNPAFSEGNIQVNIKLSNKINLTTARLMIEIRDPKGNTIDKQDKNIFVSECEQSVYSFKVKKPELWSLDLPQLYTCTATVNGDFSSNAVSEKFGFRTIEFVKNGPFMLNGQRLFLKGTHRHEDHAGMGAAETEAVMKQEMNMIKEMGANFVRLGHYQQSSIVLNLCDSLGILVWEEIPWCRGGGAGNENYKEQVRSMLANMINQHYNHPAVIMWGLANESDWSGNFPDFDEQKIKDFMSELNIQAHELDSLRYTAIRRGAFFHDVPDVYSPSIWTGWYSGIFTDYKKTVDKEMEKTDRLFHAEWGGDSHSGRHSELPDSLLKAVLDNYKGDISPDSLFASASRLSKNDNDWSESYICNLFDWTLTQQETMPYFSGSAFWIFKDFATPIRPENPVPYVNQKGVVERDFTKKESYYLFQSHWSAQKMVHIYGHSLPVRWGKAGEEKMVKVFSNCDNAELFVNGKSYGVRKRNVLDFPASGLRWNVVFTPGENVIKAVAKQGKNITLIDKIRQVYQTKSWGNPAQLTLNKIEQQGDTATIEVKALDAKGIMCLDARQRVSFGITGDGTLIDNLGTPSSSRKVELQNGRAIIKVKCNNGKSVASVQCNGLPSAFCNL